MIETIQARLAAVRVTGPKYQILSNAIVGAISAGDWKPGMRLPTEVELERKLPYSLGTIQKAYGELVRNGLVVRSRGRGSFVAPIRRRMSDPWYCRFLGDDGSVLPVYPRLVGHGVAEKNARLAQLFGKATKVITIDRVNSINDEFEVFSRFYSSQAIARSLVRLPREKVQTANFKLILLRELGLPITRVVHTIAQADPRAWRKLAIRSRPHLVLEAIAYTANGAVAYFQEIYIPPNRRKLLFDSELKGLEQG
jgi:GntR family transcriptional regulator